MRHAIGGVCLLAGLVIAGPARGQQTAADTATTSFTVDHVPVILRRNIANDVVAANVYLLGGTRQLTAQTAGIEALMLNASEGGTRTFPREQLRAITARTGATIVVNASVDWTAFGLRALRQAFDSSWAVFADRLVNPRLDSTDIERARRQMITGVLQSNADPDVAVAHLADSLLYANHPYQLDPNGTAPSLRAITPTAVRAYHDRQVVQSRLLVVIVGNISRRAVERAVHMTLGTLPVGSYVWTPPPALTPAAQHLAQLSRPLPTNYILGYYPGPRADTPDYAALRIATAVLSGRMFAEVRSREHLAYAVEAPFLEQAIGVGGLYVTTTDPAAALTAMGAEVQRLKTSLVDPAGLTALIGQFITDYFLKNETNADQASFLARAQLYEGDYRRAAEFMASLRTVTPEDIQRVAVQYMHDIRFGFVGDTTLVPPWLGTRF
ncbi:MAG TPA: pitrilysin family protein [Gemmatimonadaceae bacterium]